MRVKLDSWGILPTRAHKDDAGFDLYSPRSATVWAGGCEIIDTGVHMEIPKGYVGFIKSKSGLSVRHGIQSEGVIDSGYTGSIIVKLYNHGEYTVEIDRGQKISQIVLLPILTPDLEVVDELAQTERGAGGFGSTGKY